MDGYYGYAKAASKQVGKARQLMDPFHVMHLAAGTPAPCRQRIQYETLGHRDRKGDPLYGIRRTMLTRRSLVIPKRTERFDEVLTAQEHVAVQVTWDFYQEVIVAYDEPVWRDGKKRMFKLIKWIRAGMPKGLTGLAPLGRTL